MPVQRVVYGDLHGEGTRSFGQLQSTKSESEGITTVTMMKHAGVAQTRRVQRAKGAPRDAPI